MRIFNLIPFEGTDSIKFGMTSNELTNLIKINPEPGENMDNFQFMTADYDKEGKSIAFEFRDLGSCQVYFNNIPLLGESYFKIRELFRKWDKDLRYDEGFISFKYMIGVTVGEEDLITGVLIGIKSYYDDFDLEDDFDTEDRFDEEY